MKKAFRKAALAVALTMGIVGIGAGAASAQDRPTTTVGAVQAEKKTPLKFEDTKLLSDPDVKKALEVIQKKEAEHVKPTLKEVWGAVAAKFSADGSFEVYENTDGGHETVSIRAGKSGPSLQVEDNGDGTFCINRDRQETFNKTPLEKTVTALGKFYGQYSTH